VGDAVSAPPIGSSGRPSGFNDAVTLRPAGAADSPSIWRWRNDPDTRAASFDSAEIPWDQHERWFSGSLGRADRKVYIVEARTHPAGVTRLDIVESEAAVSINLAPEWRGLGLGPVALGALADLAYGALGLRTLRAFVKADNLASLSAFARAGFSETHRGGGVVTLQRRRC
jgi:UDP-2,4-diacetamido-2,4,6-trideoxy-beta-L-altropyranose hydrolase